MKPCALTEKEGGSPKEIWGITKEKEMLDGQKKPQICMSMDYQEDDAWVEFQKISKS